MCVCVCVCALMHSGVVRKGVSLRSTAHPSVFSNSFFLSSIYPLILPPFSLSLSPPPPSVSPLSGLQFYNLLKICVSSPAPCFLLHIQVCVCSSVCIQYASLCVCCPCSLVHRATDVDMKAASSSSSSSSAAPPPSSSSFFYFVHLLFN